jgi:hypothetical protein
MHDMRHRWSRMRDAGMSSPAIPDAAEGRQDATNLQLRGTGRSCRQAMAFMAQHPDADSQVGRMRRLPTPWPRRAVLLPVYRALSVERLRPPGTMPPRFIDL